MPSEPQPRRRCAGTAKTGKPCGANPLKPGTVLEGVEVAGNHCRAHDPDLPASARIQGPQPGSGRPRTPTVIEAIREEVERRRDEIVGKFWYLADTAERAVVVGHGPDAHVEIVPDYELRRKALNDLLDRSHGRPKQATEISGPDGQPVTIASLAALADDGNR